MKRHEKHRDRELTLSDCWDCGRQRAKCQAKVGYREWWDAQEAADTQNVRTGWKFMLLSYECDWCGKYHVARARGKARVRAVKKRRITHFKMTER